MLEASDGLKNSLKVIARVHIDILCTNLGVGDGWGRHGGAAMLVGFSHFGQNDAKRCAKTLRSSINGAIAAPPLGFRQCC